MTAKELRELLTKVPDDINVLVQGYEYGLSDLVPECLKMEMVVRNHNGEKPPFGGPHDLAEYALEEDGELVREAVLVIYRGPR